MFDIIKMDEKIEASTLNHGENVFHEALEKGQSYYHVINQDGTDYDLKYAKNNDLVPQNYRENKKGIDIYPSYIKYNEIDVENIDLSLLMEFSVVDFEVLNEYAVVIANVALKYTELSVVFRDPMANIFFSESDRIHIGESKSIEGKVLRVVEKFTSGTLEADFSVMSAMPLFHSLFFWQSLTNLNLTDIRYAEVGVTKSVGIGGVLSYYFNAQKIFHKRGWVTFLREDASRYSDEMLKKYFVFSDRPEDSDDTNTVYIEDLTSIFMTYHSFVQNSEIDTSVLNPEFMAQMDEYTEAVLDGKKTLGILIRGTDYIVSNMSGSRKMATVDEMLPMIHEWMQEDGYEKIFLATEDQDVLDKMREIFGKQIIAVSQVRHRVSDFQNVRLISDLEKEESNGENYENLVEDNTVNYFYALYILSKCESFMASGQVHGWDVVNAFRKGEFQRCYKFQVGLK